MPPEALESSPQQTTPTATTLKQHAYAALESAGVTYPRKRLSTKGMRAVLHASSGLALVPYHGVTLEGCTCKKAACASPGKHPVLTNWQKLATTDLATVVGWWAEHPDANIGGLVGPDLLVLDIDDRNGGWESFQALLDENGVDEPFTPTSMTGGKGAHFIFANTLGVTKAITGVCPGIDILAGNHSFMLPGSTHASGRTYEWVKGREFGSVELAETPGWLSALAPSTNASKPGAAGSTDGSVPEGRRNTHMFATLNQLLRAGMTGDRLRGVASAYNATQCSPPLPEPELVRIIASAESRQPSRPEDEPFTVLSRNDLWDVPEPEFLIEGMVAEGSLNMIWGDSNVGKTFIALHMAACIASGISMFGRETKAGHVQYVIAEGKGGFNSRVRAWEKLNAQKLEGKMSFIDRAVQLHDDRAIDRLVEVVRESEVGPCLLVVDTLARCFLGKDENSSRDAGLLIAGCQRLQRELDCAVLLLHHCGKSDKGTFRGSSAFEGALDTIISVDRIPKETEEVIVRCRKQREARFFEPVRVERVNVLNSAAVRQTTGPTHFGDTSPQDELILASLVQLHGETSGPVSFSEIQAACKVPKTTFTRRLRALAAAGEIEKVPGGYIPLLAAGPGIAA